MTRIMQLYMLSWKPNVFMTDQISLLHEAEDLADGINFMLKSIGEFTDADRAYVFETSENHTSTNTYEWCAAGVTPQIRNLHDIPFESMPKWIEVFLHGENILIEDLELTVNLCLWNMNC